MTTIYTGLGAIEYVTVTITAATDISTDAVQLSVGTYNAPSTWVTPDVLTFSNGGATATAKILIGNGHINPVAGTYYLWYRVVDTPTIKIQPVRSTEFSVTDVAGVALATLPAFDTAGAAAAAQAAAVTIAGSALSNQTTEGRKQRALQRYHYALAARDSEPLDIMFPAGDSLFASVGSTTYANTLGQKFAKYHRLAYPQVAAGGLGNINPTQYGSAAVGVWPDVPIGYLPSGSYSPASNLPAWGLDSATAYLSAAGKYISFTFTGTGCDLSWFATAIAAGAATLTVDGTVYGSYNAGTKVLTAGAGTITESGTGANSLAHGKVRGLTAGTHTVTWTWASGVFYLNGCFAYNGDETSGARVAVAAYSGRGTRNYIGTTKGAANASNPFPTGGQSEQWRQHIRDGSYLPDLVFLDNMANDYAGTAADLCTPTENLANLRGIIANLKTDVVLGCTAASVTSYVPSFVLIPPHCVVTSNIGGPSGNGGTMVANWQDYVANAYTIATTDTDGAVAVFDLGQRLQGASNTWDNSTYQGLLWTDHVHPSDAGTDWWARGLVEFLKPS